jgi:butyryl-CoA dehydrogenase
LQNEVDEELILDFGLSEEKVVFRRTLREFAERELAPKAAEIERTGKFPRENVKKLAELGLLGISVPVEYGGAGADAVSYALAMEEVARACPTSATIVTHGNLFASELVLQFGTEEQKKKYIPPIVSGSKIGAFSITEPEAGSDVAAIRTTAVQKGDEYVLNGRKQFCTLAGVSDAFVIFAKTDPEAGSRGISAFIVDRDATGFSVGEPERLMGLRAIQNCPLYLDECRVPRGNLLGQEGMGMRIALTMLDAGRIGVAMMSVGIVQAALEASIKHAKERMAFGQPIANFQSIQWMLADMALDIEAGRLLALKAAWLHDQGVRHTQESSMAKLFCSEMCVRHTLNALQIHGGYGYTEEFPLERLVRASKLQTIGEGTSEMQRLIIARNLIRG